MQTKEQINAVYFNNEARYNTVDIIATEWDGRSGVRIPAEDRCFDPFKNAQIGFGAIPASCSVRTGVLFRG